MPNREIQRCAPLTVTPNIPILTNTKKKIDKAKPYPAILG
ncbi:hypothetical protein CU025_0873 [Enterococcus faecium]|nr:hypothetical protein EFAU085_01482 [Enterococcus faecium Aus0085]MBK4766313.1 hypothetical protein [Enterococcus faecium]MBK4812120.1 hypothetical protein [Enterococcus faecium]MBK4822956.1 hypothetical protein [Enterococcus faecium]MBK4869153.1 hypothetical protein [Enterococcus faecium]